jgi:hypothetical protein
VGEVDWAYVIAGLAVPAATVLGLRLWLARSHADAHARQAVDDPDKSDLAGAVAAVQDRLTELTDQLETLRTDWEERDRRLTRQLNALLTLTERATRIDLSFGGKSGTRRSPRP